MIPMCVRQIKMDVVRTIGFSQQRVSGLSDSGTGVDQNERSIAQSDFDARSIAAVLFRMSSGRGKRTARTPEFQNSGQS